VYFKSSIRVQRLGWIATTEWSSIGNGDWSILIPEFVHASIDELSQTEPDITLDSLRLLHESGCWRNNPTILSFIHENYVRLGLQRSEFGSEAFWLALFDVDEDGLNQCGHGRNIADYLGLSEMYHTRVCRFNTEARAYDLEGINIS